MGRPAGRRGAQDLVVDGGLGCLPCSGACRVCLGPITGRQIVYCSAKCRGLYYRNHQWIWARRAAKIRARRRLGRKVLPGWACARCGAVTFEPQVNHIVPLNGERSNLSCGHHQENLEVLCRKPCHLEVTGEQRAAGLIRSRRAEQAAAALDVADEAD